MNRGDLFFGVADELAENLDQLAAAGAKVIVLRVRRTHYIDATCLGALEDFLRRYQKHGGTLILVGLTQAFETMLRRYGLAEKFGPENLFPHDQEIFGAANKAAKDLSVFVTVLGLGLLVLSPITWAAEARKWRGKRDC